MRRALPLIASLALALLLARVAGAESPRERLELLLSDHERLPGRAELLAISPQAPHLLREMVEKPSARALARSRALALLRLFPGAETARVLREAIRTRARSGGGLALLELQQALSSYAVVAQVASLRVVQPFLSHPSPDLRHAVVGALGLVRSPRVLPLLEARLASEPSAMVRHRIEVELRRLRGR